MSLEHFPSTPETGPAKENWFKRLGSKALTAFENAVANGYVGGRYGGMAWYYTEMARQAEQKRLEAEERLLEPSDLIDLDEDEINIIRGQE